MLMMAIATPLSAEDRKDLRHEMEVFMAKQIDSIKNGNTSKVVRGTAHYSGPALGPAAHKEN